MQNTRLSVASPIATSKVKRSPNLQAGYICEYFSGSVAPTPGRFSHLLLQRSC